MITSAGGWIEQWFQCRKRQEVCCNTATGMMILLVLLEFQCRKRQEVCCNILKTTRRSVCIMGFNAASGKRSVATPSSRFILKTRHRSFQCRKRQEVCCNNKEKFLGWIERVSMPQAARGLLQHTVSWKPHEHWPENEVLDNLHEKAPIWHFFRVDTVSFSCEKLASAPAVEGFNVSMICLDNLPPF